MKHHKTTNILEEIRKLKEDAVRTLLDLRKICTSKIEYNQYTKALDILLKNESGMHELKKEFYNETN